MVGKILIVDGVATNRIVLKVALGEAFYQPILAADGESCLHISRQVMPDLILLDLMLPDVSGIDVITQLRADPTTRDIPILAVTSISDRTLRVQALRAGADDVLTKQTNLQPLFARVRNILRSREGVEGMSAQSAGFGLRGLADASAPFFGPATVSLLLGRPEDALARQRALAQVMSDHITVQTREEALVDSTDTSGHATPDIFVLDADATGISDALRLMSELRSRAATRHAAICILRKSGTADSETVAYDQGADDLVSSDVDPVELSLRLKTLIRRKRRDDQMRASVQDGLRMAMIDPLTGLHNRRYALPQLTAIAEQASVKGSVFAVMVIDLDHFKSVNDRYGHATGDTVLVEVARRLKCNLRADDLLARIGGEEFLVALPCTSYDEAAIAADRLCRAIEEQPVRLGPLSGLQVTISIGLAVSDAALPAEDGARIIDRADHALLLAKSGGRNKVTISRNAA
jgi:two-component system, cell cycle response regulator